MLNIYYNFLLNMWKLKKCDISYLEIRLEKGQINQNEYNEIISTPQFEI